ncbi:YraN family protein [Muriicola marianensis]|nr:YraN family protein [Muriicola marianensis]
MRLQNELGRKGEDLAAGCLEMKGYTILERNYRFGKAEIDLIARKGNTLAVVEVKMRRAGHLQSLNDTIGYKKKSLLIQAADHYVLANTLEVEVRFDIVYILHHDTRHSLEHLEGAFSPY